MKRLTFLDILFPLTLLSFEAVGVTYWNVVFSTNTRWLFLIVLLIVVVVRGEVWRSFQSRYGAILAVYAVWCVFTAAWSIVPFLSIMKAAAFVLASVGFIVGGQIWAARGRGLPTLSYLLPIVALALFAGVFEHAASTRIGDIEIYQGLTGNPNYLGMLAAAAMPFSLWYAHSNRRRPIARMIGAVMVAAVLLVLWLSASRASILCALFIGASFFAVTATRGRVLLLGLVGMFALGIITVIPAVHDAISTRVITKGADTSHGQGVFFSRKDVWAESYQNALEGGVFGVGYGATAGDVTDPGTSLGLTSVGYGREKGNTQLAVWEETGVVGLLLYSLLIISIGRELLGGFRHMRDQNSRVELALLMGLLGGFFVQSIFEAWWVSPGSPEFALFFTTVGVATALSQRAALAAHAERLALRTTSQRPGVRGAAAAAP